MTSTDSRDVMTTAEGRTRSSAVARRGAYEWVLLGLSTFFAVVAAYFVFTVVWQSLPAFKTQGFNFFTSFAWSPTANTGTASRYGGLAMIFGTLITSAIAMIFAVVVGTGTSLAVVFLLPPRLRLVVATIIELLAAVPSVVYGIWGFAVLAPWLLITLSPTLSHIPLMGNAVAGSSFLLGGIVLGVMVLPTYVAISREVISAVPNELIEASLSLGATRWQTLWKMVLPTGRIGLFGATTLALGRAVGETVAMALVAGSVVSTDFHLLKPGVTIAGWIATQWGEAEGTDQVPALFALGVILMILSLSMSVLSNRLVARQRRAAAH